MNDFKILAINPGSTSTKLAVYLNEQAESVKNIKHTDEELAQFRGRPILDQLQFRSDAIEIELQASGHHLFEFAAVVGRGGLLPPLASGTYKVNEAMLEALREHHRGEHASNLGAFLAQDIAERAKISAFVVDPVSVDEWDPRARISGSALLERSCLCHALNTKAVAKRFAREHGMPYEVLKLIVVHLGSGVSVSAHRDGRMMDNNTGEDGPFAADRSGSLPVQQLIKLCFSGKFTEKEIDRAVFGDGGFYSYLGTKDLKEVERCIDMGDAQASAVFDAMVYRIAKEIGSMAAVLHGRVDAILFTGGMAHSERLIAQLSDYVKFIAPVHTYPGEDELQALVEGALRVLRKEEEAKELHTALAAV